MTAKQEQLGDGGGEDYHTMLQLRNSGPGSLNKLGGGRVNAGCNSKCGSGA